MKSIVFLLIIAFSRSAMISGTYQKDDCAQKVEELKSLMKVAFRENSEGALCLLKPVEKELKTLMDECTACAHESILSIETFVEDFPDSLKYVQKKYIRGQQTYIISAEVCSEIENDKHYQTNVERYGAENVKYRGVEIVISKDLDQHITLVIQGGTEGLIIKTVPIGEEPPPLHEPVKN